MNSTSIGFLRTYGELYCRYGTLHNLPLRHYIVNYRSDRYFMDFFFVTTGHSSHPVCLVSLGGSCSDSNIAVETCCMCSKTELMIFLYPKCAMSNSNSWKSYF